jgi:hypothetical protein
MVGHVSVKERQSPSLGHYHKGYFKYLKKNMETLVAMIKLIITEIHCIMVHICSMISEIKNMINLVIEIP